ncbi:hypothetical protein HND92_00625 [Diaphorobacter sp. JS3050]|nr:hypothetical protein [Diaphorobacter sp. JS3050]QJY31621.1 hypothetical protein HND92_00625 [Diaphorobacter sp. JS3050]
MVLEDVVAWRRGAHTRDMLKHHVAMALTRGETTAIQCYDQQYELD